MPSWSDGKTEAVGEWQLPFPEPTYQEKKPNQSYQLDKLSALFPHPWYVA